MYHQVTRYSNHICQLTWAYSFTAKLEATIADGFQSFLLEIGRRLDLADGPRSGPPALQRFAEDPSLAIDLRGVCVVFKPPNWEVDAKGKLCKTGAAHLSDFMKGAYSSALSPVLVQPEFEYGFIHRLDVPSSGLILTGTHFEGYSHLQFLMHTYTIGREYSVLLGGDHVAATLTIVDARVDDLSPDRSVISDRGRPAETHVKAVFHVARSSHTFICQESLTLVAIHIFTGRRHQIRVHMQHRAHPTVTDEKYSYTETVVSSLGLEREIDTLKHELGSMVAQH